MNAALLALLPAISALVPAATVAKAENSLFHEVYSVVQSRFYDAQFVHDSLPVLEKEFAPKFNTSLPQDSAKAILRTFLGRLHASHTYLLTPQDPEYYQLGAVFAPFTPSIAKLFSGPVRYPSIGICTAPFDGKFFIVSVMPGSPAEQAGILAGDEILWADGKPFRPVESFRVPTGTRVFLTIRRKAGATPMILPVSPSMTSPADEALDAEKASVHVEKLSGKAVGYIHIYSYAGSQYQDALVEALAFGALRDADALVIDLRFGMGGADPAYLNLFNRKVPTLESAGQDGARKPFDLQWRKPTVFLVDRTSRSGKEIIAYGAKAYGLAVVAGDTTAGAVLGGALTPLSNGDLLYLAEQNSWVDGIRLEGTGVAPDVYIPWDFRYMQGRDARIAKTMELAARLAGASN